MARIVPAPTITSAFPRVSRPATRRERTKASRSLAVRPISILGVWRDALATFSAHWAAVLVCALFGFAAPVIIGQWLATQAVLSNYAWVGPIMTLASQPAVAPMLVLTVLGLLGASFARGVITWLALAHVRRTSEVCHTCSEAVHVTLLRYPALFAGSLVHGVFTLACILVISSLTHSLQPGASEAKALPIWAGPSRAWNDMSRQLARRSINLLTPDPGSPFAESLLALSPSTSQPTAQVTQYEQWLTGTQGESALAHARQPQHSNERWFIAAAGLILLFLAEPLLRFRTIMVMAFKPPGSLQVSTTKLGREKPWGFATLAPLLDSACFGLRNFGIVTLHIWVMRIAFFALCLGLIELPLALLDHVILPNAIMLTGKSQLLPVLHFVQVSTAALVSALALAFGVVYDARLYAALDGYGVATA